MIIRFIILICLSFLLYFSSWSQSLPVVKANSPTIDIRDGENLMKGHWQVSPKVKPDIYYPNRLKKPRKITFYTDVDSISFIAVPGKEYDFIVLYKGDSCYTRISGAQPFIAPIKKDCTDCFEKVDSIPFTLGSDGKIYIHVSINNSEPLNMMFDTGSDRHVISRSGQKKVKIFFNETEQSVGFGGTTIRQKSRANQVNIGRLHWDGLSLIAIDQADGDGIIGYSLLTEK
jgi:hypothetical protein